MKYPTDVDVDWTDFSNRAKMVLLQHGDFKNNHHFAQYDDEFIRITYDRDGVGLLTVTRKKMPGHEPHLHDTTNPVYMASSVKCIRIHGEGRYIYQHLIDLTTEKKASE